MWGKCFQKEGSSPKFRCQPKGSDLRIVIPKNLGLVVGEISQPLFVSRVLTVST